MKTKITYFAALAIMLSAFVLSAQETGTFTDSRDNQEYNWVKIGEQVWMAENLNFESESGSWYFDDDDELREVYGMLYNYPTALEICPDGWHLPTDKEWTQLVEFLGGDKVAGGKMKSTGDEYWDGNTGATNESGFNAHPGGFLYQEGDFLDINYNAYFWSTDETSIRYSWARSLLTDDATITRYPSDKGDALSVRCVQD
jgi:uncharacterized protein (TIGR02145 family)